MPRVLDHQPTGALTVEQACERYGLSRSTLSRWRRKRGFPTVKVGRKVLVPVAQAERWFADHTEVAA